MKKRSNMLSSIMHKIHRFWGAWHVTNMELIDKKAQAVGHTKSLNKKMARHDRKAACHVAKMKMYAEKL